MSHYIHTSPAASYLSALRLFYCSLQVECIQKRLHMPTSEYNIRFVSFCRCDFWSSTLRYVPHANRALRSFNMYLNVRKPPLRSKWNPLSFFFPRPNDSPTTSNSRSPSPPGTKSRSASTTRTIPPIPPSKNPRGELIFSSRVDKAFRESYERYRSAFERRRDEKGFIEWKKTWYGKLMFWERPPTPMAGLLPNPHTPSRTASISSRGRGSRSGTPPVSTSVNATQGMRDRSGSPIQRSSPPREKTPRRERVESLVELDTSLRTIVLERSFGHAGGLER